VAVKVLLALLLAGCVGINSIRDCGSTPGNCRSFALALLESRSTAVIAIISRKDGYISVQRSCVVVVDGRSV
jgi:hypothetical protein